MKNLKIISIILVTFMLIFSMNAFVFAADEGNDTNGSAADLFAVDNGTENNDVWGSPEVVNNDVNNETIENTEEIEVNNTSYVYNEEENETTSNSNSLAYTGIGDSNGMIALIVVISAVVAVYSAKKFNDYKNI